MTHTKHVGSVGVVKLPLVSVARSTGGRIHSDFYEQLGKPDSITIEWDPVGELLSFKVGGPTAVKKQTFNLPLSVRVTLTSNLRCQWRSTQRFVAIRNGEWWVLSRIES